MSAGKTSKYFKYAIGETLLVVIGILIALQINNWNEGCKSKILEHTYLNNIQADLLLNTKALQEFIDARKACIEAANSILEFFDGTKALDVDEFNRNGIDVMVWFPFQQHDNTYKELMNSGNLSLLSNKSIKDYLQNMEASFKRVAFIENEMQQDFERYLYESFFNKADLKTSFENYNGQSTESLDMDQVNSLLEDQLYKNGFVLAAFNSELLITEYSIILETTNQLILLIDKELGR